MGGSPFDPMWERVQYFQNQNIHGCTHVCPSMCAQTSFSLSSKHSGALCGLTWSVSKAKENSNC